VEISEKIWGGGSGKTIGQGLCHQEKECPVWGRTPGEKASNEGFGDSTQDQERLRILHLYNVGGEGRGKRTEGGQVQKKKAAGAGSELGSRELEPSECEDPRTALF